MPPAAPTRLSVGKRSSPTSTDSTTWPWVLFPSQDNTSGNNNTAIGSLALENSATTSGHVAVGRRPGPGSPSALSYQPIIILSSAIFLVCTVSLVRNMTGALSATSMVRRFPALRLSSWSSIPMEDWARSPLMELMQVDFAQRHLAQSHSRRRQASHAQSRSSEFGGNHLAATEPNRDPHCAD